MCTSPHVHPSSIYMHTFIDTCVVGHRIVLAIHMLTVEPLLNSLQGSKDNSVVT